MLKEKKYFKNEIEIYLKSLEAKFDLAMPEVHRQVKVYEEKLKTGKLTKSPKYSPLFCD